MQPVSRQRVGKQILAATNTQATIVTVGNCVFSSVRAKWFTERKFGLPNELKSSAWKAEKIEAVGADP
jgi:hypothetical protein